MIKRISTTVGSLILAAVAYLLFWPVPIEPVAWQAPQNQGYSGVFAPNEKLDKLRRVDLGDHKGPEDVAVGPDGRLYMPTHDGSVLAYNPETGEVEKIADTRGRALGIEFSRDGSLYVADAYRGLLKIDDDGRPVVLASEADGNSPILYADDLDVAADGTIFFTDASTKFGAEENGGTLPASLLDLMEHGPNGRVLRYDPATGDVKTLYSGFSFANGLALTADGSHMLVVETGTYSVKRMSTDGQGEPETILSNLPGFPDNINRNADGTFWLGLASPRSDPVDAVSDKPFIRKIIQRLPGFLRPKPQRYGFVIRIDEDGQVLEHLQGPSGNYALTTGAIEGPDGKLYISSLTEPDLGVLDSQDR